MSDLYTKFVSTALFPVQERLKRHDTVQVRRNMEASQWWSHERLEELRVERLKRLLRHAAGHVPYYRDLFARLGFDPASVQNLDALQSLPFLTKPVIRANSDALKADDAEGLSRFNTGGSSGEPLIFYIGRERVTHDVAAKWRATRWWDVDIGDKEIVVWGSPIELGTQDRIRMLRDGLMRTELLPAFDMSEARMDEFVARIRSRRPAMLFGYPSAISLIAEHAARSGIRLDDLGIKVVFVTSERLYDHQRQIISTAFGCPVANGYGSRDAGFIAHECPSGSLHITAEDVIVEIVDEQGRPLPAGSAGEIVVTHLATGDYPFIRYRTGDVGVLDDAPCACGRGLPVLKEVQGRSTDFVVTASGAMMHGLGLIYVVRDIPGIASFKICQETLALTWVEVVPGPDYDPACAAVIIRGLKQRLGESVEIQVRPVDAVTPEKSGKHRYVVSKVPREASASAVTEKAPMAEIDDRG